ncbi:hypothetical protein D3C87_1796340 [compost metagenome]
MVRQPGLALVRRIRLGNRRVNNAGTVIGQGVQERRKRRFQSETHRQRIHHRDLQVFREGL